LWEEASQSRGKPFKPREGQGRVHSLPTDLEFKAGAQYHWASLPCALVGGLCIQCAIDLQEIPGAYQAGLCHCILLAMRAQSDKDSGGIVHQGSIRAELKEDAVAVERASQVHLTNHRVCGAWEGGGKRT